MRTPHSPGVRPLVSGLALRGYRRGGARLAISEAPSLVPGEPSLLTHHGHYDGALPATNVAFQMKELLPGAQDKFAISDWYGERWPE
jgi:hypothetical protein